MSYSDYPECNMIINNEEYYEKKVNIGKAKLYIPGLCISILCSCIFILFFQYNAYNIYVNNEGYNLSFVFLQIFSLIFFTLIMLCVYKYFKTERLADKSKDDDNKNQRPCISQNNGKLIVDE